MQKGTIAPVAISILVIGGFGMFSFLAMKPDLAGVKESVVLFLLGAWSTMAAGVVNYWVGSSNSSSKKDDLLAKKDETIQTIQTIQTAAVGTKP